VPCVWIVSLEVMEAFELFVLDLVGLRLIRKLRLRLK
jgi:hypothetical protein